MASQDKASGMASGPPRSSWAAGPASISVPHNVDQVVAETALMPCSAYRPITV